MHADMSVNNMGYSRLAPPIPSIYRIIVLAHCPSIISLVAHHYGIVVTVRKCSCMLHTFQFILNAGSTQIEEIFSQLAVARSR